MLARCATSIVQGCIVPPPSRLVHLVCPYEAVGKADTTQTRGQPGSASGR